MPWSRPEGVRGADNSRTDTAAYIRDKMTLPSPKELIVYYITKDNRRTK